MDSYLLTSIINYSVGVLFTPCLWGSRFKSKQFYWKKTWLHFIIIHHFAEYIVVKWSKQLMQVFSMNISIKMIVYSKKLGQRLKLNRFKLNSSQQCFHTHHTVESKNKNDRKLHPSTFKTDTQRSKWCLPIE